nr:hypothetical protein [Agrobacterium salinitolerans]
MQSADATEAERRRFKSGCGPIPQMLAPMRTCKASGASLAISSLRRPNSGNGAGLAGQCWQVLPVSA